MPRPVLTALTAGAATLLLAACTGGGPVPTPTPTMPTPSGDGILRIGTIFSTTGPDAADAASQTAAVNAAIRELDAAGGVNGAPVEVVNRNGGTAGDGLAEAAFADLVARGVDAVIGPSSAEVAQIVVPLAAAARIPLISASAAGDRPADSGGWYLRSIPSIAAQGSALRELVGADASIAVVRSDAEAAWAQGLGELGADVVTGSDPAAEATTVADADPDAVVVALADAGDGTGAALTALLEAGIPADRIWIAGRSVGGYPGVGAALAGAHAVLAGVSADPAFLAHVVQEDPGTPSLRYAAEAYDATILVALAAVLAGDDGGASIAATLRSAAGGGIPCTSFGACADVLSTEPDIDYDGPSGPFVWDEEGDRDGTILRQYVYDAAGGLTAAK